MNRVNRHVTSSLKTLDAPWPTWRQPPSKHPSWASQSWQRRDTSPYHQRRKDYQVLQGQVWGMGAKKTPISDFTLNTVLKKSQKKMFQVSSWQHLWDWNLHTLIQSANLTTVFSSYSIVLADSWQVLPSWTEWSQRTNLNFSTFPWQFWSKQFATSMQMEAFAKPDLNPSNLSAFIFQPKFWKSSIQHLCAKAPLHPRTYRDRLQPHWLCLPDLGPRPAKNEECHPVSLVDGTQIWVPYRLRCCTKYIQNCIYPSISHDPWMSFNSLP